MAKFVGIYFVLYLVNRTWVETKDRSCQRTRRKSSTFFSEEKIGYSNIKTFVVALYTVLDFPGTKREFKLGTMYKYTALKCIEKSVRYFRCMTHIYWEIVDDISVIRYMDLKTFSYLEHCNPSNNADREYIRLIMYIG